MYKRQDHEHGSSEEEEDLDGVSLNHGVVAASGVNDLVTTLTEPITEDFVEMAPNKQPIGKAFKKDGKIVTDYITKLTSK